MTTNPETIMIEEIQENLMKTIKKLNLVGELKVQEATKVAFGDYSAPVFQLAGENKRRPNELAKEIATNFLENDLISEVSATGGFVNFKLDRSYCSRLILSTIIANEKYGQVEFYKGKKIMVEHTSANPNAPIHIGNFRGSIIGDTYARILKATGAEVITNFYVDDLGHQVPVMVIGHELVQKYGEVPKDIKIDHFMGWIYGIVHTLFDIQKFRQELTEKHGLNSGENPYWLNDSDINYLKSKYNSGEISKAEFKDFSSRFEFLLKIQEDIYNRFKELYDFLMTHLQKEKVDLPKAILDINRRYMDQEAEAVRMVRSACEEVLRGQKETLELMGIKHDYFDWEAELQWSSGVAKVLRKLEENGYLITDGKAKLFDANKAADLEGAREYLNLKSTYEVPKAILITSKGDTLYLLRDIPYSLKKSDHYKVDRAFNVIGKPQELTQLQLNLALRAIGREDVANKLWHLNYEFMELRGAITSISARRLQYITPQELFEKTRDAVMENFLKDRDYPEEEKEEIAKIVAIGAIKYSIIAVGLMRKMLFDPQEVISLTNNTSPFIQYAYARAQNILAKREFSWGSHIDESLQSLGNDEEWALILKLAKLPGVIEKAAEQIKPELTCSYLFETANIFNKFYDSHRVLNAPSEELINARLALTFATGRVLSNALQLLGIESPKRM